MIDKKVKEDYASPEDYQRTRRAEDYAAVTRPEDQMKKDPNSPKTYQPTQYDQPVEDVEPGYKEW